MYVSPEMSTRLFINAFSSLINQNREGSIMRGGGGWLAPTFSTNYYKKHRILHEAAEWYTNGILI